MSEVIINNELSGISGELNIKVLPTEFKSKGVLYMETNEIWKEIPGYEGLYEVSNMGRVKSLDRIVIQNHWQKRCEHIYKGKLLKLRIDGNGRQYVTLSKNAILNNYRVHRLVLEVFVGKCPEGMEGCHNNDICTDNRLSNLRWDIHDENIKDAIRNCKTQKGDKNWSSKLNSEDVLLIKEMLKEKIFHQRKIARMIGVSQSCIAAISSGRIWGHIQCE